MTQRRAKRGTEGVAPRTPAPLRFMRAPHNFEVQLGLISWKQMKVTVRSYQRGGTLYVSTTTVDLDLEGRIPANLHAVLYATLEDFLQSEWIERISRTF